MDTNPTSHASLVDFPVTSLGHDGDTWYRHQRPQAQRLPATVGTAIDVSLRELGPMLLIHADAADSTVSNGRLHDDVRPLIACGSRDRTMIQICLSGHVTGTCAGRAFRLEAGDIAVIDGARPFHGSARGARTLTLAIERTALARMLDTRLLHGHVLRRNDPLCQLLSHFICALYRVAPQLDATRVDSVVKSAGDMLAACLRPSPEAATAAAQTVASRSMPTFAADAREAGRAWGFAGERQRPRGTSPAHVLARAARKAQLPGAFRSLHLPLPAVQLAATAD
jgi:hypothetical protein